DGRSEARSAVGRSRSSQSQGQGQARSQAPNGRSAAVEAPAPGTGGGVPAKRDRTWLYAVVGALLAIIGGGAWMHQRGLLSIGSSTTAPAPAIATPSVNPAGPMAPMGRTAPTPVPARSVAAVEAPAPIPA